MQRQTDSDNNNISQIDNYYLQFAEQSPEYFQHHQADLDTLQQQHQQGEAPDRNSSRQSIRYSGDLELKLSFDRDPMTRPSNSFKGADAWFKQAQEAAAKEASTPANVDMPPPAHNVPKASEGRHFSIYFDNEKDFVDSWSKNAPALPGSEKGLQRSGTVRSTTSTNDSVMEYGAGISSSPKSFPIFKQYRFYLYVALAITSIIALALQGNINIRFGGKVYSNGKWNGGLIRANIFVAACVGACWLALGLIGWYHFKAPSLPKIPVSYLVSSKLWIAAVDMGLNAFFTVTVLATTIDIAVAFRNCDSTATKLNFTNKSSCTQVEWAVGFGALTFILLLAGSLLRVRELHKIGLIGKKKGDSSLSRNGSVSSKSAAPIGKVAATTAAISSAVSNSTKKVKGLFTKA